MEIEEILMRRDGCTREEARRLINECRQRCFECLDVGDYEGVEDIIIYGLRLELDYADALLS